MRSRRANDGIAGLTSQRLEPACNISLSQIRLLLRQNASDDALLQGLRMIRRQR